TLSMRRGYRVDNTLRVVGVDVSSKSFVGGASAPRELLRRYHFTYDPAYHASLLTAAQVEGRCAAPIAEDSNGLLPATPMCPRLPAMTFDYQHVGGASDIPGYEAFDESVHAFASPPSFSLDSARAELFDVDADSLPDLLVTSPVSASGGHQVFLNGGGAFGG